MDPKQHNVALLSTVGTRLGELWPEVVFLGGATTTLLITDPASIAIRATRDVDAVVEVSTRIDYQFRWRDALLARGFREDTDEGAPLCRWVVEGVKVDFMPSNSDILGFSNRWYPAVLDNFTELAIGPELKLRVVAPAYFVATKLEAFRGRGEGDYMASHDVEDIVTIVDGRPELSDEIATATPELQGYVRSEVSSMLGSRAFLDALPGHLPPDVGGQARVPIVIERLRKIVTW